MARILIIDDEASFRQGVARYLRGLGHVDELRKLIHDILGGQ